MGRKIEQVHFVRPAVPTLKNVAAYARVSTGKDAMLHSLSAQVSYYSELIQQEPGWRFCGVYADEALTGTRDNREEFQRLLDACRAGQVDMIITNGARMEDLYGIVEGKDIGTRFVAGAEEG